MNPPRGTGPFFFFFPFSRGVFSPHFLFRIPFLAPSRVDYGLTKCYLLLQAYFGFGPLVAFSARCIASRLALSELYLTTDSSAVDFGREREKTQSVIGRQVRGI